MNIDQNVNAHLIPYVNIKLYGKQYGFNQYTGFWCVFVGTPKTRILWIDPNYISHDKFLSQSHVICRCPFDRLSDMWRPISTLRLHVGHQQVQACLLGQENFASQTLEIPVAGRILPKIAMLDTIIPWELNNWTMRKHNHQTWWVLPKSVWSWNSRFFLPSWIMMSWLVVAKMHCKEDPFDTIRIFALLNQDLVFAPRIEGVLLVLIGTQQKIGQILVLQNLGWGSDETMTGPAIDLGALLLDSIRIGFVQDTTSPVLQAWCSRLTAGWMMIPSRRIRRDSWPPTNSRSERNEASASPRRHMKSFITKEFIDDSTRRLALPSLRMIYVYVIYIIHNSWHFLGWDWFKIRYLWNLYVVIVFMESITCVWDEITLLRVIPTMTYIWSYILYILTNYLTYILTFYLTFYLTYMPTLYLAFYLTYILAFCLAFYLTYSDILSDIYSGILFDILSGTLSDI